LSLGFAFSITSLPSLQCPSGLGTLDRG
jgi:hypothetical protein